MYCNKNNECKLTNCKQNKRDKNGLCITKGELTECRKSYDYTKNGVDR